MSHCHTLIATLRQQGCRLTPQREMIVKALAQGGRHMTAEEILEIVWQKTRAVNIATVYRTLDLLVEKGLVTRIDLGEGQIVYATNQHGPHIHLVCLRCGCVTEADAALLAPLKDTLKTRYGFTSHLEHIALYGVCTRCEQETRE